MKEYVSKAKDDILFWSFPLTKLLPLTKPEFKLVKLEVQNDGYLKQKVYWHALSNILATQFAKKSLSKTVFRFPFSFYLYLYYIKYVSLMIIGLS